MVKKELNFQIRKKKNVPKRLNHKQSKIHSSTQIRIKEFNVRINNKSLTMIMYFTDQLSYLGYISMSSETWWNNKIAN